MAWPLQKQVGHLLEGGVLSEVGDLVAAVHKLGLVDRANLGVADGHAGQTDGLPRFCFGRRHWITPTS